MPPNNSLDRDKAVKSLDKLFEIFKDISFNADEVFKERCPYKNAKQDVLQNLNVKINII